ncbi:MAG: homocysteine S-methyltransferase [Gammaproteobacteria bacterium]|nr:homocysteine S-methyltransferase [Gammaproteobacteria bacterium]
MILDGGLATQLEARGHDLSDELWSARVLIEQPDEIRAVHQGFIDAGAECVITSSYQASIDGLRAHGVDPKEMLLRSVALAKGAKAVAASVGPYGAALADGSEFTGVYPEVDLAEWHRERFQILDESDADLLACETIPRFDEAQALASLLHNKQAWFSFCCRDEKHISDGTPIAECAAFLDSCAKSDKVFAIGVNCTPPQFVESLICEIRSATQKPIVVYPNSGERYENGDWHGKPADFAALAKRWRAAGAEHIGGCCRTGPDHIRLLVGARMP